MILEEGSWSFRDDSYGNMVFSGATKWGAF